MVKVNVRARMKRERERCVLSKGKRVPRNGLHLKTGHWSCSHPASQCCCGCMSQTPSREVSCWQGNTLQQGQRRDGLSLSPRGCEICLSKTVTVSRGPFSSLPLTALVTSGNSLSPFCFLISLV